MVLTGTCKYCTAVDHPYWHEASAVCQGQIPDMCAGLCLQHQDVIKPRRASKGAPTCSESRRCCKSADAAAAAARSLAAAASPAWTLA